MDRRGMHVRKIYKLICWWCQGQFQSKHELARYCCNAHREAAYRERLQAQAREDEEKNSEVGNYQTDYIPALDV